MANIPGPIYLAVGVAVTYFSRVLQNKGSNFTVFYWVGLLMLVIGLTKTIIWLIMKRPSKFDKKMEGISQLEPIKLGERATPNQRAHDRNYIQPFEDNKKYQRFCARCRLLYQDTSNYCSKCGDKLNLRQ